MVARFLTVGAVVLVFAAGVLSGISYNDHQHGVDMAKFWQVYDMVHANYVGSVDDSKLIEGATKGLVQGLGDPFSSYLPSSEKQSLDQELSGQFEGIGAELTEKDGLITVVAPLADSPAEKAGLKAKDIITAIDDTKTDGMTVDDAVTKIRGPKDTTVKLTVVRDGLNGTKDITIKRENIQVKSVNDKMLGTVGYMQITQFGEDTVAGVTAAVKDLASHNPTAIVIDLRDNPGGYLNDVAPIAGNFIPPSVVVKEKYRDGKTDELRTTDVPTFPTTPIYILINGGSASAAEILAGALQDYKRATLVGEKSFGKGSVQSLIDLPGSSALRITIAEWLTPNGRAINKVGITPDVVVAGDKTDTSDPVLDKALQLAQGK